MFKASIYSLSSQFDNLWSGNSGEIENLLTEVEGQSSRVQKEDQKFLAAWK